MEMDNLKIGDKGKVTIVWDTLPINYTREKEKNIIEQMSKKYSIPKDNIKIEPNFLIVNNKNGQSSLTNEIIENIQDPKFHHKLFESFLNENNIKEYDLEGIIDIDNKINSLIDFSQYDKYRKYEIKWLKWDNFLSYGDDNYFDFTTLNGLVLLNGEPSNQSGKSTFAYDLLHFLLFGKTGSGKADVLSKMFNIYRPEITTVVVEGCLIIEGNEYIIKRTLSRPSLNKRTDKSKVTQKVQYFKLNGEIEEELIDIDNEEGITNTQTNLIIKEAIGNERDFDLVICANSDNLKSLISLKETDRGRLLSKWIGLSVLEDKDVLAREKFNKDINPKLVSNKFNRETLRNEVNELNEIINHNNVKIEECGIKLKECDEKIKNLNRTNETLLSSKREIDNTLLKVDVITVTNNRDNIIERGKIKRAELLSNETKLSDIGEIIFSEDEYKKLIDEEKNIVINIANKSRDIKDLEKSNESLRKSEICPTCKRKLENVDYSETIKENGDKITILSQSLTDLNKSLDEKRVEISKKERDRLKFHDKNKLFLLIEKNRVDIELITKDYKETCRIIKDLESNKTAIENNNKIEIEVRNLKITIDTENLYRNNLIREIEQYKQNTILNTKQIEEKERLIQSIIEEEKLILNWKTYLQLIGKNGISKVVLRNTLPIINVELQRLLSDVVDFDVEVIMNEKNDVSFNLIRDGITNNLSSGSGLEETAASLALRVVLSNISTMPRPNFIVFDEVLGGVAKENYDKIKLLYDRICKNYSFILQITHLNDIIDWHNQIVTISKNGNISKINSKTI